MSTIWAFTNIMNHRDDVGYDTLAQLLGHQRSQDTFNQKSDNKNNLEHIGVQVSICGTHPDWYMWTT